MLYSMTGFGYAMTETNTMTITAEVKSINSKYFDLSLRTPRNFPAERDIELRNYLKDTLQRGKVSVSLDIQYKDATKSNANINADLLKGYFVQLKAVADELQTPAQDIFRIAALMPDVVMQDSARTEFSEEEWQAVQKTMQDAVKKCEAFRAQEGEALGKAFAQYTQQIGELLVKVNDMDASRLEYIRQKVKGRVTELLGDEAFDANRFEQEMTYYIEKLDISEEKIRLKNHLDYFIKTLKDKDTTGRKLNFITQEIGREINTIGSKANDATVQRFVVEMKDELEKIKEQLANIL
ncbi:MAG: YicC family protein [Bacteroidetes bacterium]|nr:MAG: YicC family protein [Bacteroidota bacterium]